MDAASDQTRLAAFGAESRAIVESDFAWPALARRQVELYAALLGWL